MEKHEKEKYRAMDMELLIVIVILLLLLFFATREINDASVILTCH